MVADAFQRKKGKGTLSHPNAKQKQNRFLSSPSSSLPLHKSHPTTSSY